MNGNGEHSLESVADVPFLKRNIADILTLSRFIIGFVILALSFAGNGVYQVVVILTLIGAATDILDGKAARRYLGDREGRLGKYDVEIDTLFLLCVLGYFSLSGMVIHTAIGLGWICLVLIAAALTKKDKRVLIFSEVVTVISLLTITLIYNPAFFGAVIAPVMVIGLFINRHRVFYLLFEYWPSLYFHRKH